MNPTEELVAEMSWMNWPTLRRLLDAGADINVQNRWGETLLMKMVRRESLDGCTKLLKRGASLHVRDRNGFTAWSYIRMLYDNLPLYSLFLQYGADVNQYAPDGWTIPHRACQWSNPNIRLFLFAQGADPRLPVLDGPYKGKTAYDLCEGPFWSTPEGIRARLRWDTLSIQEVFILASERGLVPIPSYLW